MNFLRRLFRRYFTRGGRALLAAGMVSALAGIDPTRTQLDGLFVMVFSTFLVGLAAGLNFRRKLGGSWELPSRVTCGESPILTVEIQNKARKTAYELEATMDSLPPGLKQLPETARSRHDKLDSDEATTLELQIETERRGAYTIPAPYVGTTFPFGFLRFGQSIGRPQRLLVTPRIHPITQMNLNPGMRYQPGAIPIGNETGESMEFKGVREYREGDSLRKVHWKLWARRGIPVVREYSQEYFSRVGLILDTYKPPSSQEFESAAEVAASIADYLSNREAMVDFFAAGSNLYPLSMDRQGGLTSILDLLACVEPDKESPYELLRAQTMNRLSGLSSIIVITYQLTPEREDFLQNLRVGGIPLRVICLAEGNNNPEVTYIEPDAIPAALEML